MRKFIWYGLSIALAIASAIVGSITNKMEIEDIYGGRN